MRVDPDIIGRYLHRDPLWFLDIGVGEGTEAEAYRARWPELRCLGLEPNVRLYEAARGRFPGTVLNVGAWSRDCRLPLADFGLQTHCFGKEGELVQMLTVDDLVQRYHVRSAVLWLDIEGAELEALRGAAESLKRYVCAVNCETRLQRMYPRACCMSEVDSYLAAFGFRKVCTYNVCDGDDPHEDAVYVK